VPLVALSQAEIEQLESECGAIDDILPLSPVQEGMLFHIFYDAGGPDIYAIQIGVALEGRVDENSLREAANTLLRRHRPICAPLSNHAGLAGSANHSEGLFLNLELGRFLRAGWA